MLPLNHTTPRGKEYPPPRAHAAKRIPGTLATFTTTAESLSLRVQPSAVIARFHPCIEYAGIIDMQMGKRYAVWLNPG